MKSEVKRCGWGEGSDLYLKYHDTEWGVPVFDDRKHFEFLVLESAQAGLSWITILKKRENYRKAYDGFDPKKVARYGEKKKAALLADSGIVRNRLKIEASINNAIRFLEIQKEFGSFSEYIWGLAEGNREPLVRRRGASRRGFNKKPVIGKWKSLSDIPVKTELSDAISADLKKMGFKFLGSVIIYSHLQATGIVNDHIKSCFRYAELVKK